MQMKAEAWRMLHPLQLKITNKQSKQNTKASKRSYKHVQGMIHHWQLNYMMICFDRMNSKILTPFVKEKKS